MGRKAWSLTRAHWLSRDRHADPGNGFGPVMPGTMVWLHAFKKKTQKTPAGDLELAEKRMKEVLGL